MATFCYNIARKLPIQISDPSKEVPLVYIDDVVSSFLTLLTSNISGFSMHTVYPEYKIKLGSLADLISSFSHSRSNLITERVGSGLTRALYSTYLSYLPVHEFSYDLKSHSDLRGHFVEVLKTLDSGQFSFFTAFPGVTRGGHFHNTKTEKFVVIQGSATFRFRNLDTNKYIEIHANGDHPTVVDSIPGWSHDITNVGENDLIVLLWANEIFDRNLPDTYSSSCQP